METIKTGVIYRQAEIRAVDDERRVELAFSSEEPVERSFGIEILDHGASSVDMEFMGSGRAPLLVDHDPTDQVGVVEKHLWATTAWRGPGCALGKVLGLLRCMKT